MALTLEPTCFSEDQKKDLVKLDQFYGKNAGLRFHLLLHLSAITRYF